MRIISHYKDYYDVVAGQGVDLTRIFTREVQEKKGNFPLDGWNVRHYWRTQEDANFPREEIKVYHGKQHRSPESHEVRYIYVLFAGKLYGGIAVAEIIPNSTERPMSYYWDLASWTAKAEEIKLSEKSSYTSRSYHEKGWKTEKERCEKILSIKGDEYLRDWAIDNKISIAVACGFFEEKREQFYQINPALKTYNFQKVLDPFTAYQELDQWTGGVLGQNPEPDEVSDLVKIQQHGFTEWSFRKHKLDNTKDRKK